MYGSPKAFWARGANLRDYGVNALFIHAGSITTELMERAAAEGARVFAEFPTLNGKGYVEKHEDAWPINAAGAKAPAATWFLGACPSDRGFREYRMGELQKLIERFPLPACGWTTSTGTLSSRSRSPSCRRRASTHRA